MKRCDICKEKIPLGEKSEWSCKNIDFHEDYYDISSFHPDFREPDERFVVCADCYQSTLEACRDTCAVKKEVLKL